MRFGASRLIEHSQQITEARRELEWMKKGTSNVAEIYVTIYSDGDGFGIMPCHEGETSLEHAIDRKRYARGCDYVGVARVTVEPHHNESPPALDATQKHAPANKSRKPLPSILIA